MGELQDLSDELSRLQGEHEASKAALLEETSKVQSLRGQLAVYETRLQTFQSMRGMISDSHAMLSSFQDCLEEERKEKAELQKSMEQEHMRTMLLMHILRQFKQKLSGMGGSEAYSSVPPEVDAKLWSSVGAGQATF